MMSFQRQCVFLLSVAALVLVTACGKTPSESVPTEQALPKLAVIEGQVLLTRTTGVDARTPKPWAGLKISVIEESKLKSELKANIGQAFAKFKAHGSSDYQGPDSSQYFNLTGIQLPLASIADYYTDSDGRFKISVPAEGNYVAYVSGYVAEENYDRRQVWILRVGEAEVRASMNVLCDGNELKLMALRDYSGFKEDW